MPRREDRNHPLAQNIMKEFGGDIPGWGVCESVLLDQNRLICTPGGSKATLVALNPENGEVIWKALVPQKDRAGYASPVVAEVGGLRQYVQFTNSGTVGLRADSGDFLWRDDSASNGTANCSSPLVAGDFVFTSSNYGTGGSLVKLVANPSGVKAERVYHTQRMSVHHGDMVIVNGLGLRRQRSRNSHVPRSGDRQGEVGEPRGRKRFDHLRGRPALSPHGAGNDDPRGSHGGRLPRTWPVRATESRRELRVGTSGGGRRPTLPS